MTKSDVMRRLHEMVEQLSSIPDSWFEEGVYPLHKVTFARDDSGERITLVVGVSDASDD